MTILGTMGGGGDVDIPTSVGDGSKDVTTAGTRERLVASATPCRSVIIRSKSANTGNVFIGGSTVASTSGVFLKADESLALDIKDLYEIYIDSSVNGEGVVFTYVI